MSIVNDHHVSRRAIMRLAGMIGLVGLIGLANMAPAQNARVVEDEVVNDRIIDSRWEARLTQLEPRTPVAYFELAEEIADTATDDDDRHLARHLFALAGLLDTRKFGRSACLAMADLERSEHARRRFQALAWLLDQRDGRAGYLDLYRAEGSVARSTNLVAIDAVTEAFSHYRRGFGNRAMAALRRPGAMELLETCDRLIVGGLNRFLEDCRVYRTGETRPNLDRDEVTAMLRLEAALLAGDDRTWTDDLLLYDREPLVEVDPGRLADTFGVDAQRAYWRRGRWVADP